MDAGQISMFGTMTEKVTFNIPAVKEFDEETKLKLEKEVVGIYLSGHPLSGYADLFDQFSFNTSCIKPETDDIDAAGAFLETGETEKTYGNDDKVVFGAIIADVKKVFTKSEKKEMCVLRVEDLYGGIEVMLFPKIFDKVKHNVQKDAVVKISGKISMREGEAPSIVADHLEILKEAGAADALPVGAVLGAAGSARRLYLKYNTKDDALHTEVMNILRAYGGEIAVAVRCTASGDAVGLHPKVRECQAIRFELEALLGKENLMFK
jgi:DNA polymerase III alpha subunit